MNNELWDLLILAPRIATAQGDGYGLIDNAAIGIHQGLICFVGPQSALPGQPRLLAREVKQLADGLVTPALIDAHTHLVFAGRRADEFERRLAGESYAQIAASGGGIRASVSATRAASADELLRISLPRAYALAADGVATLEIKSGYGLDLENEAKQLRCARQIGERTGQRVRTTFLGAHAVPPEYKGRPDEYLELLRTVVLPSLVEQGLVDAIDAYCEHLAFSVEQLRPLFQTAQDLGVAVKLHADQLSDCGGAALAAEFSGLSADHLEYTGPTGIEAMAMAGTVAMILPGAFVVLGETTKPPISALRSAGVDMAVATDLNPGSSPLLSLRAAMHLACAMFGMTPTESFLGTTRIAAKALGIQQRTGCIQVGMSADLSWWDLDHPVELSYWLGGAPAKAVWCRGKQLILAAS